MSASAARGFRDPPSGLILYMIEEAPANGVAVVVNRRLGFQPDRQGPLPFVIDR